MKDRDYMQLALSLAGKGKGFTSPNPCVGAVVVKNGRVVGRGFHKAAGMPHAEVEAINDAGPESENAAIYVTLEPCNHFGRTPPCTRKIIDAGIKKVVVACNDPNPDVCGNGINYLKEQGIEVVCGICEDEARVLMEDFIWFIQHKTPFVILKCASTLDGRIATSTGDSKWITNEASRAYGHRIRHEVDAILIGSGTLHADDPSLTCRIDGVETKSPARIILDSRLSISESAKVVTQNSDGKTIVAAGPDMPVKKKDFLEQRGVKVIQVGIKDEKLDLQELMVKLGEMTFTSILIEGGSRVAASVMKEQIVNKVMFFLAPKFLGGSDGIPVFDGKGPEMIKDAFKLENISINRFDDDILVSGYLK